MKRPNLAVAIACAFLVSLPASAAESARVWTYKYVLATAETEQQLAPITEHIIKTPALAERGLLDVTAETLLARFADSQYPEQNKIRLIRVLEAHGGPRYHSVLQQVQEKSPQPAVRDAAKKSLPRKQMQADDPYVPGSVDLRTLVAAVDSAALAAKPTTDQGRHLAAFPGGTLDQLFEWAGKPHQVVSGQTRVSDGILIHVKIQRLAFFYRGLGRAVYGYKDNSWRFQAIVADPLAFEKEFGYRDRAAALGLPDDATLEMIQLVSGHVSAMKNAVQHRYRRAGGSPPEFVDTAAEILLQEHATARDPGAIDAYAWICRLLLEQGDGRYAGVLARVAAETKDEKLRRYATLAPSGSARSSAPAYAPGSVSLPAQRAKYPTLYPESTYTSGQL